MSDPLMSCALAAGIMAFLASFAVTNLSRHQIATGRQSPCQPANSGASIAANGCAPKHGRNGERMRILVVEDDADLADAVTRHLRRDGHAVDWEHDGESADDILGYQQYDLVLLDIGLPNMSGFDILRRLRSRGHATPVMMLTARSEVEDRVDALDVGADDYLPKPFDFREFDARCRALLRRAQGLASNVTTVGRLVFDRAARSARIGDEELHLPNREFRLLEILIGRLGKAISKEQISAQLFDFDDEAGMNAIELYVGRLRRKLGSAITIRTIRGFGYMAEAGDGSA
ncbi:response regulator transcription factor [Blastomonas sp.]|uniref:response regulator transcription factor n=1 Tax=Blastomonas sp. TaxID=1909299 RepID=UPI0026243CD7|nr:response regulator transcription factor [Blastomonas sp.]MDM7955766.1 response regulator transcription factor [Blastomonas sp.]